MPEEDTTNCILENEIDTIEDALRKKLDEHISKGDLEQADATEEAIRDLDKISVC